MCFSPLKSEHQDAEESEHGLTAAHRKTRATSLPPPRDFSTRIVSTSASVLEGVTCPYPLWVRRKCVRHKSARPLRAKSGHSAASFDHLVRARLHRRRHANAERPSGFKIDYQFKLGCLHDWQFVRLFALENFGSLNAGQPVAFQYVRSVAHQTASRGKVSKLVNRGHCMTNSQGSQLIDAVIDDRARTDHEPAHLQTFYVCKCCIKVSFAPDIEDM